MQSVVELDDLLLQRARDLTGTEETAVVLRRALETLVRVESGRRLIGLAGTMPDLEPAPRRRSDSAS